MHPLKKDEFRLVNRMKFEMKNVLQHLDTISLDSGKINATEIQRRLQLVREFSHELANVQEAIDQEIAKHLA